MLSSGHPAECKHYHGQEFEFKSLVPTCREDTSPVVKQYCKSFPFLSPPLPPLFPFSFLFFLL